MHLDSTQRICKKIIFIATCAILALPLFVDRANIVSTLFPKTIVFQVLVEISVIAWVLLILRDSSYRPQWKHPVVRGFTFFIGILFLTLIFSLNPSRSFWSTPDWMMGIVMYLHFYLWFLILTSVFRDWNDWKWFFLISVSVCTLVCFYGLAQYLQLPFVAHAGGKYAGRIISTIGNPLYLAAYAMMNVFFTILILKRVQNLFGKLMLGAAIILFITLIILAGSRGVIFTLSFTIFCAFLIWAISATHHWKRYICIAITLMIALLPFVTFFVFSREDISKWSDAHFPPVIHRLLTKPFQDKARPILWQTAWKGFLDRPITGWGHDNYGLVFATYVPVSAYGNLTIGEGDDYGNYRVNQRENALTEMWYDRAHNSILDILATTGLLGLGAYILFLGTLFFTIIRAIRTQQNLSERTSIAIVGCALAAYVLHTLTAFDTPMTYLMFVLGIGYVVFATSSDSISQNKKLPLLYCWIIVLLIVPLGVINGISYYKGRIAKIATEIMVYDSEKGIRHFQKALRGFSPINEYIRRDLGFSVYQYVKKLRLDREKEKTLLVFAIRELEKNIQRFPRDLESAMLLAALYREGYSYNAFYADRAISLMKRMNTLYPQRRDVLLELAENELIRGSNADALIHARRVVALDSTRGDAYWLFAKSLSANHEYEEAFFEIDKAVTAQYPVYTYGSFFLQLAQTIPDSQIKKALEYTNRGYSLFPQTIDYRAARYILFSRMGNKKQAQKEGEWIKERDSSIFDALKK